MYVPLGCQIPLRGWLLLYSWTESVTNAISVYVEKEHSICQLTRTLLTGFYSPLVRYFYIAKNEDGPL